MDALSRRLTGWAPAGKAPVQLSLALVFWAMKQLCVSGRGGVEKKLAIWLADAKERKAKEACVRLIGPKCEPWEGEGVLSGNRNCCDRRMHLERGQWRGLPHLRLCRLWVLKES